MSISYQNARVADEALTRIQKGAATVGAVAAGNWEGIGRRDIVGGRLLRQRGKVRVRVTAA
jgi:hypothetical protein